MENKTDIYHLHYPISHKNKLLDMQRDRKVTNAQGQNSG